VVDQEEAGSAVITLLSSPLAKTSLLLLIVSQTLLAAGPDTQFDTGQAQRICLVATGLGGLPEFEENFAKWADATEELCREDLGARVIRLDGKLDKRADFRRAFAKIPTTLGVAGECWVFLIGHGNYDGRDYKFNITGPDIREKDLVQFFNALNDRKIFALLATSSSGVLIPGLSGSSRVVISATKSEHEKLAPLFMSFFLEASRSAEADLDKNGSVSLKEAFAHCEASIKDWYQDRQRLQTEHPILYESADQVSLSSLAYLSRPPEQAYRSLEARQLIPERVRLEREVEELKLRKTDMSEMDYFERLEDLLVELATLNEKIRQLEGRE